VLPVGGTVHIDNGKLVISAAQSAILLTRIEWFSNYNREQVDALASAVEQVPTDYPALLARQRQVQSEIIDRMSVDFGGRSEFGISSEELLIDQKSRIGYSPALLEQYFDMSRYWLLAEGTGDYPSIAGHLNINVNLQIAPAAMADLPEASETFTKWIEGLLPDSRKNAENIFGTRGALFSVHPDQHDGVLYHFAYNWPHRRRLVLQSHLGPLPGYRRPRIPAPAHRSRIEGSGLVLRGLPERHRPERKLYLRAVVLARELACEQRQRSHGDQRRHGHFGLQRGADAPN